MSLLVVGLALACSSEPGKQDSCPVLVQQGCPADALTFDTGIGELLHTRCYPCHAPGGVEQSRLLTDYAHVHDERRSIATQLEACSMPPSDAPPLTNSERQQIIDWFTCGGPE